MQIIEIITIVFSLLLAFFVIGRAIYRKSKHLPMGECACCQKNPQRIVKAYRKKYKNK